MNDKFSKIGFILSIVGAAIGLGNAWKFPYMVGINGGSAFVLIYLIFALIVGLSIFFAEMAMGKISQKDTVNAFKTLAIKGSNIWKFAGIVMITGVLVASFYTLIIGWVIKYVVLSFSNLPSDIEISGKIFNDFVLKNSFEQILYFTIAFIAYFFVLTKGVKAGIEKINLWLIPTIFLLLMLMLGYSFSMDGFSKAAEFLLVPDFSKINSHTIFMALGLAFFTMCVGIGAVLSYSTNLNNKTNLFTSSLYVVVLNVVISIIIGLIVFTFVFEFNSSPADGVGLAFVSLPTLFAKLGFLGNILCFVFFLALVFAGLTSAISMVEPCILFLTQNFNLTRTKAIFVVGSFVYILGVLCALSNIDGVKDDLVFFGKGFFDLLDFISSNIMLPLGGIIFCVFVGYFMKYESLKELFIPYMGKHIFQIWYFLLRFVAPVCVFLVLIGGII
ncbi:sodium-dependent transporter [Campylobacter pinnipediorum]|uniref:sodium-dependent transporter n=1 Tax=Campylobacter pinnipediorum TaxID=1965231 RepID=UPI00084D6E87|nr:sodium-dependent transporter [Campylobacter pinnipediorum]